VRIATITNWAYGITVALTLVSGTAMLLASRAEERERAAVEQRERFEQLSREVEEDAFRLSTHARLYVASGDPSHLIVYRREAADQGPIEARMRHLVDAGARRGELEALRDGLHEIDLLRDEQAAAILAAQQGRAETARKILFGAAYERDLDRSAAMMDRFDSMLDQRSDQEVALASAATTRLRFVSELLVAATALLFLLVLFFVLTRRILRPVVRLSDVVTRLAAQDYAVEPPDIDQVDEIGDMAQAINVFRENGLERQRLEKAQAADHALRDLLARMTQRLQGCDAIADIAEVVQLFAAELAPAFAGRLYVQDDKGQTMAEAGSWLEPTRSAPNFPVGDCWALRRGQLHRPAGQRIDIRCPHARASEDDDICVPLTAQGETIGLIYFEKHDTGAVDPPAFETYLELLAENVGLALANVRLREALRALALIDPLTGLSNRRQLDATLRAQSAEAERSGAPLSCLMLAIDHFKRINDGFGHDAGDAVLRAVGEILAGSVREDGMAFRYGGEEFLLLMPDLDIGAAKARAERIRERIAALDLRHEGREIGPISCSIGIAAVPIHGRGNALVAAADAALLHAKEQGRDRVVTASPRGGTVAA
jgi:diguanylate cyclase (GGDEF)-like protein